MKKKLIQITGVPALPLNIGERAVVFHDSGYVRTGAVQKVCRLPMGSLLLTTADAVYRITPCGTPDPARCAAKVLCA